MTRKEYNELKRSAKTTPGIVVNESHNMFIASIFRGAKEVDVKAINIVDDYNKRLKSINKMKEKASSYKMR